MFLKSVLACDKKPVSTLAVAWRHHLFVPGGQPLPAVRVPASGPPTACTWLSQHLSLQAQSHFRIPKSIPTAALSLPTTSLTQSWGFNTKSPSQTWPCDPVIRTKYSVTPKSPSWPCRPRGGPANLGVTFLSLPFAAHTLATTWSRWPGPTIYPAQAPSWFLWGFGDFCFFFFFFITGSLKIWWPKNISTDTALNILVEAAFALYEANLRLRILDVGEVQCPIQSDGLTYQPSLDSVWPLFGLLAVFIPLCLSVLHSEVQPFPELWLRCPQTLCLALTATLPKPVPYNWSLG